MRQSLYSFAEQCSKALTICSWVLPRSTIARTTLLKGVFWKAFTYHHEWCSKALAVLLQSPFDFGRRVYVQCTPMQEACNCSNARRLLIRAAVSRSHEIIVNFCNGHSCNLRGRQSIRFGNISTSTLYDSQNESRNLWIFKGNAVNEQSIVLRQYSLNSTKASCWWIIRECMAIGLCFQGLYFKCCGHNSFSQKREAGEPPFDISSVIRLTLYFDAHAAGSACDHLHDRFDVFGVHVVSLGFGDGAEVSLA